MDLRADSDALWSIADNGQDRSFRVFLSFRLLDEYRQAIADGDNEPVKLPDAVVGVGPISWRG